MKTLMRVKVAVDIFIGVMVAYLAHGTNINPAILVFFFFVWFELLLTHIGVMSHEGDEKIKVGNIKAVRLKLNKEDYASLLTNLSKITEQDNEQETEEDD